MQKLLQKKKLIKQKIKEIQNNNKLQIESQNKILETIHFKKEQYLNNKQTINTINTELANQYKTLKFLKNELTNYKKQQIKQNKEQLQKQLNELKERLKNIKIQKNKEIFTTFTKIKELMKDSEQFKIFKSLLTRKYKKLKEKFKNNICNFVKIKIENKNEIEALFEGLDVLIEYENYFDENIIFDIFYENISLEFQKHFVEKSRIDKPEWFFNFLLNKISLFKNFYKYYKIRRGKKEYKTDSIFIFYEKINSLIKIKFYEISKIKSKQKINVIHHFIEEYKKYIEELENEEDKLLIDIQNKKIPNIPEINEMFFENQKEYLRQQMLKCYKLDFQKWFSCYKKIISENILMCQQLKIDYKIIKFLINEIAVFLTIFVENINFSDFEEKKTIRKIFTKIQELNSFIKIEEQELILNLLEIKNKNNSIESEMANIELSFNTDLLIKANHKIFKIIKNLQEEDVYELCHKILNFRSFTERRQTEFILEFQNIIEVYDNLNILYMKSIFDNFLIENIIFKIKLNGEYFLKFKEIFYFVKELFEDKNWNTENYIKIIGNVFDGNDLADERLKSLYKH